MFENPDHNALAVLIVLVLLGLLLIVLLCTGAVRLFVVAADEWRGTGIVIYILLWAFLSPIMAVMSILAGIFYWLIQICMRVAEED
jgi:uncharacterized BrkB/YihY/UPF0761 family membrane protein